MSSTVGLGGLSVAPAKGNGDAGNGICELRMKMRKDQPYCSLGIGSPEKTLISVM